MEGAECMEEDRPRRQSGGTRDPMERCVVVGFELNLEHEHRGYSLVENSSAMDLIRAMCLFNLCLQLDEKRNFGSSRHAHCTRESVPQVMR